MPMLGAAENKRPLNYRSIVLVLDFERLFEK
jgi:hypothetical protein